MAEIIVALDAPDLDQALSLVDALGPQASFFKVGLELYTAEGPRAVTALREREKRVFLDLKLHDIPNTVARAVRSAAGLGVELLTVHTTGGETMMRAAAAAAEEASVEPGHPPLRLLGVTVLTSLGVAELEAVWGREIVALRDEVGRLGASATEAGLHGVVCSTWEAEFLRRRLGPDALIVTPGIRPAGGDAQDQNRVATPGEAARAGASHLVVGRAVSRAPDPAGAFREIREQVDRALEER